MILVPGVMSVYNQAAWLLEESVIPADTTNWMLRLVRLPVLVLPEFLSGISRGEFSRCTRSIFYITTGLIRSKRSMTSFEAD